MFFYRCSRFARAMLVITVFLALSGCSNHIVKSGDNALLGQDEAFLMMRVASNKKCKAYFSTGGFWPVSLPYDHTDMVTRTILVRVPAKRLTLVSLSNSDGFPKPVYTMDMTFGLSEENQYYFDLKPGSINYVGDMVNDIGSDVTVLSAGTEIHYMKSWKLTFFDNLVEATRQAEQDHPEIFARYPVVSVLNERLMSDASHFGSDEVRMRKTIDKRACLAEDDVEACLKRQESK